MLSSKKQEQRQALKKDWGMGARCAFEKDGHKLKDIIEKLGEGQFSKYGYTIKFELGIPSCNNTDCPYNRIFGADPDAKYSKRNEGGIPYCTKVFDEGIIK
ncbi:MAG: hypothetical protein N3E51_04785 [Candidatus Micrarchaeota archaeon]|nr:hypothetical protein [Candidatus Micrarchaeota archaeon]